MFPDVKTSDYYNQLNFKDGQGFIDKEMITYIIKDILNRMTILDGNVSYAYKQEDDQNLYIAFKWENKSQKSNITYKFSVNRI
ncbi:MHO_1590 family protein [Metamycoplasma hominis]|uniref:MHO_1590 family protein n=1 Tax=Metamycoplasma hominis TaxID=2098 RepID=UPI0035A6F3B0